MQSPVADWVRVGQGREASWVIGDGSGAGVVGWQRAAQSCLDRGLELLHGNQGSRSPHSRGLAKPPHSWGSLTRWLSGTRREVSYLPITRLPPFLHLPPVQPGRHLSHKATFLGQRPQGGACTGQAAGPSTCGPEPGPRRRPRPVGTLSTVPPVPARAGPRSRCGRLPLAGMFSSPPQLRGLHGGTWPTSGTRPWDLSQDTWNTPTWRTTSDFTSSRPANPQGNA